MNNNQFHIQKAFSLFRDQGTHPSIPSGGGEALWSKSEKEQRVSPPGRRLRGGSGNTGSTKKSAINFSNQQTKRYQ
jgi:hypothetical protein